MYLWRKFATQKWADQNEEKLGALTGNHLAVVEQPNRKRLQFEVASSRRANLRELARQFGGRIRKLPENWLKRSLRLKTKPIKVGNRTLIIPAGAAFGTGEHATTAMCLRLLERAIRFWGAQAPPPGLFQKSPRSRGRDRQHARRMRSPDLVVDLGTGSGILALAAKILGAKKVIGIDNDPIAISTAKQNAILNKIRGVEFCDDDARQRQLREADVVTANLFSEVLIEILPNLRGARLLILSGILRNQEARVRRALTREKAEICEVRRRGKWVAMLARHK